MNAFRFIISMRLIDLYQIIVKIYVKGMILREMDMEEKLVSFLKSICDDTINITEIISDTNLRLLTIDYQKGIDVKYYFLSNALKLRQDKKNKAFLNAIEEFLILCEEKDLKPIFLKGLFLATDIYNIIETRMTNDIDILINPSEFKQYNDVLETLGYIHEFYNKETDYFEYYMEEVRVHHIGYLKEFNDISVHVEIHGSVINPTKLFKDITGQFISNVKRVNVFGMKPFVLDLEYNLVMLMMHFFKHLPLLYFHNMLFKNKTYINLSNIHDIALFVQKYTKVIDWIKVLEIAKEMLVTKYILMVAVFVNKIYTEVFDKEFIDLLSENRNFSYMEKANLEYVGMGKFSWLFDDFVDILINIPAKEIIFGRMPQEVNLMDVAITDNSKLYLLHDNKVIIDREFSFDIVNKFNSLFDIKVKIHISLDKEYFNLFYSVKNKSCCSIDIGDENCFKKDGVEIIVIKKDYIVHRMFTITKRDNKYALILFSNNMKDKILIDKSDIWYELYVEKDIFTCRIQIPWSFLDINLEKDKIIPFNLCALISNPETLDYYRACNVFKENESIWYFNDISGIENDT